MMGARTPGPNFYVAKKIKIKNPEPLCGLQNSVCETTRFTNEIACFVDGK